MIVGIDLGTTNSAVAIWRNGEAELIPNGLGDLLTPSAVSIDKEGVVTVGLAAREKQAIDAQNTATLFKRYMGTDHKTDIRGKYYSAEELSSLVLRSLKEDAEAFLGEDVTSAVITVPAYFNDKQRRATKRAGELAGLEVARLVNEPTAAALAYGIQEKEQEEPFLVFDLGGGTFDVSLVEIFDGIIEVRASAGDNRLGGEDFNQSIVAIIREKLDGDVPAANADPAFEEVIRAVAERTRRTLTSDAECEAKFVWQDKEFSVLVTKEAFKEASQKLVARLRDPVLRSLRDSNTKVANISEVILVGGSTRMPIIRETVTRMFGRFPDISIDPDHAVALGAAVQAGLKSRDADLEEIRLTDVCPFTLGVESTESDGRNGWRSGVFSPIIERNTVIPASRVDYYNTLQDNQKMLRFNIYQGESREVSNNVKLGEVELPVPPKPAGQVVVECRFTYDTSGLLEVDVKEPETGKTAQVSIYDKSDSALEKDLEKRRKELAKLKIHPRDEAVNAAMLARAKRCYEGFLGAQRDYVGELLRDFTNALNSQEPRTISTAREEIGKRLDELEGETFL